MDTPKDYKQKNTLQTNMRFGKISKLESEKRNVYVECLKNQFSHHLLMRYHLPRRQTSGLEHQNRYRAPKNQSVDIWHMRHPALVYPRFVEHRIYEYGDNYVSFNRLLFHSRFRCLDNR